MRKDVRIEFKVKDRDALRGHRKSLLASVVLDVPVELLSATLDLVHQEAQKLTTDKLPKDIIKAVRTLNENENLIVKFKTALL